MCVDRNLIGHILISVSIKEELGRIGTTSQHHIFCKNNVLAEIFQGIIFILTFMRKLNGGVHRPEYLYHVVTSYSILLTFSVKIIHQLKFYQKTFCLNADKQIMWWSPQAWMSYRGVILHPTVVAFLSRYYTGCFTTLGHNCRRWFPRSLWSKKFI
jgi:hypothetical protein